MKIVPLEEAPHLANDILSWIKNEWGKLDILQHYKSIRDGNYLKTTLPHTLIAIADNGSAMGTSSILLNDMDIRPHLNPWLGCLYVHPKYRKKSVAKALFASCEVVAYEKNISSLYLWTSKVHLMAKQFGWKFIEEVYFENENVFIMEKHF